MRYFHREFVIDLLNTQRLTSNDDCLPPASDHVWNVTFCLAP